MSRRDGNTTKVFVGSLPAAVTTDDLKRLFAPYGKIVECDIANRCGFLHLEDKELAFKAIDELNNTTFMGGRISVEKGRVKPPRRSRDGGPMRGARDRSAPYTRDDSYARGLLRNGMGAYEPERDYPYGDRYPEYDRGAPVRSYASDYGSMADRRPMYDDRRGYMDDRRGYAPPNGYERRLYDDRGSYSEARGGYDDRRLPPSGTPNMSSYDDRRPLLNDRRPLLDQADSRGGMGGYDRGTSSNDIFSRRGDSTQKPGMPSSTSGAYGDRDTSISGGYTSGVVSGTGYSSMNESSYGNSTPGMGNAYTTGGNDNSYSTMGAYGSGGYTDTRGTAGAYGATSGGQTPAVYGNTGTTGYSSTSAVDGYGESYNSGRLGTTYDTAYPLQQQRSFASSAGGPGLRRDMPPGPGHRY